MHSFPSNPGTGPSTGSRPSLFRTILIGAAILVAIGLTTGLAFWMLDFVFHLAALAFRVAVIVAVAAFVWRLVTHRRNS